MNIFSGVVVYILIWWMVFFCTLPFGIKIDKEARAGAMPGAPVDPGLKRKVIITTAVTSVMWLAAYGIITANLISFHDMAQKMAM